MTTRVNEHTLSPTLRQCIDFLNAAKFLKSTGSFNFRCAVASLAMEANRRVLVFNEEQQPSPGLTSFKSELALHRENCTVEIDGKKSVDAEAYMDLYEKTRIKYSKALEDAQKLQKEANRALENKVDIYCKPIPLEMLEQTDQEAKLDPMLLSAILPFTASAQ